MGTHTVTFDKDDRKRERTELVRELRKAGALDTGRYILCPFHEDTHPSGEIKEAASGYWYFYCHKCGIADDAWALQARVEGRSETEILVEARALCHDDIKPSQPAQLSEHLKGRQDIAPTPQKASERPQTQMRGNSEPMFATIDDLIGWYQKKHPALVVQEVNHYTDPATGKSDICTIRYLPAPGSKKVIAQVTPVGDGWSIGGLAGDRKTPMFNRIRVKDAERVLIVEGEKCVRAVTALGIDKLAAVTSLGGSKNGSRCDWSMLAGKRVYLWRDFDEEGERYQAEVIACLEQLEPTPQICVVRVEELGLDKGEDVADYLPGNGDLISEQTAALELCLFDAEPRGAARSLGEYLGRVAAGELKVIPFEQKPILSGITQALMPGTVTLVCGEPETAKSLLILEEAWRQFEAGTDVKVLMLESTHAFHLRRTLIQMSGEISLGDHEFIENNPAWAQNLFTAFEARLDAFGRHLEADGSLLRTLEQTAEWVTKHAANGARVIFVDPVTAAVVPERGSWNTDKAFMLAVKRAAETYNTSIVLVTHPRHGKDGKPGLDGMAGGKAYARFSDTVVWVKRSDNEIDGTVFDGYLSKQMKWRRSLEVFKARNGKQVKGVFSRSIAVELNQNNLGFQELGLIT